eukprot:c24898_g1_i4 orf=811-1989(-)
MQCTSRMMALGNSFTIKCPSLHSHEVLRRRFSSSASSRTWKLKQAPLCSRASKEEAEPSSSATQKTEIKLQPPEVSNAKLAPPRENPLSVQPSESPKDPWTVDIGTYERLFSNVNEVNLQHEPGSLTSAILLIAGTTVGAGILAIPAVTQEAGFVASSFTCLASWLYMVTTGLLIAEVNISTMCELGSGGVSLVSMAMRTLGRGGVLAACVAYLFIHYALLVAYVARSSEILMSASGIPQWICAAIFSGALGGLCYFGSQKAVGAVNGFLVAGIIGSFGILVFAAAGDLNWGSLLRANFAAVPQSIPIIALSFVYQNVVPVVCTSLEGDLKRISIYFKRDRALHKNGLPCSNQLTQEARTQICSNMGNFHPFGYVSCMGCCYTGFIIWDHTV